MKKNELATLTQTGPLELAYSKEKKIRHLDSPEPVIEMLNYIYVLLNVKSDNQLNEIEESVLNGLILNNFSNFTINEIKHAFRLAVSGELGLEMYNKLDSIIFSKVLKTYKEHKALKIRNYKKNNMSKEDNKITQAEIDAIEKEFIEKCILPYIEERKSMTEPKISWEVYSIFKHFWKRKAIKLNKTKIAKYKKEAEKYWKIDLKKRRSKGDRVSLDEVMSHRTQEMYSSCIALYHEIDAALELEKIDFIGWHDKL